MLVTSQVDLHDNDGNKQYSLRQASSQVKSIIQTKILLIIKIHCFIHLKQTKHLRDI